MEKLTEIEPDREKNMPGGNNREKLSLNEKFDIKELDYQYKADTVSVRFSGPFHTLRERMRKR